MAAVGPGLRPNTSSGGLNKIPYPSIVHPKINMDTTASLAVQGEAQNSPLGLSGRSHTMADFRMSLPQLSARSSTGIELPYAPEIYGTKVPGDKGKFRNSIDCMPSFSTDEILYGIAERISMTSAHSLKHLFKSHDPNGQGQVTREALKRIFQSLVGYIETEQFNRLLRRLGLHSKSSFTYEDISVCLRQTYVQECNTTKQWLSPTQKKELKKAAHPEEHLRYTDFSFRGSNASAAYCISVLREKFRNTRDFHIFRFLPSSCTSASGVQKVNSFHLRGILKIFSLQVTDEDFDKLWDKFDKEGVGSTPTSNFLKVLGLDNEGYPSTATVSSRYILLPKDHLTSALGTQLTYVKPGLPVLPPVQENKEPAEDTTEDKKPKTPMPQDPKMSRTPIPCEERTPKTPLPSDELKAATPVTTDVTIKRLASVRRKRRPVEQINRIIDQMHWKFEDNYLTMEMALKLFEYTGDGFISRLDLRTVLKEFRFNVPSIDLEQFLARCGLRVLRGQVPIAEFLAKFWNKSESGFVHRVLTNKHHLFHSVSSWCSTVDNLTVEQLEAKLIEYFHGHFLKLLGLLRQGDKHSIGVVTQYEFKDSVEKILGQSMSDKQWAELKADVGLDQDGLVPYPKFLLQFNANPNSWNKKEVGQYYVRQVTKSPTPQIYALKEQLEKAKEQKEVELMQSSSEEKTRLATLKEKVENFEKYIAETTDDKKQPKNEVSLEGVKIFAEARERPLVQVQSDANYGPAEPFIPTNEMDSCLKRSPEQIGRDETVSIVEQPLDQDRPLHVLQLSLRDLFRQRFHSVDKVFKMLDRKMTGRISRLQFADLVKQCGLPLRPTEIDTVWKYFNVAPDGMYTFAALVRKCSQASYGPPPVDGKLPVQEAAEQCKQIPGLSRVLSGKHHRQPSASHIKKSMTVETQPKQELVLAVKPEILRFWEPLKLKLRQIDKLGTATVPVSQAKEIFQSLMSTINEDILDRIFLEFDLQHDGRFHYIEFLKLFLEKPSPDQLTKQTLYNKYSHRLHQQLLKDWKSLRKAFKKFDSGGNGYLSVTDFKNVLKSCGIQITEEDFYHILSEFDTNMSGRILYDSFIDQLLTTL